jgi:hypothetical protein
VISSPPATDETGAIGHEVKSRKGIGWKFLIYKNLLLLKWFWPKIYASLKLVFALKMCINLTDLT